MPDLAGALNNQGYPMFTLARKTQSVHRYVCREVHGLEKGQHVLHVCDRPACILPTHLKPGTRAENMADAAKKGRMERGESRGNSQLTDEAVLVIRSSPLSNAAMAKQYGVSPSLISRVRSGERWQHV